MTTVWAFQFSFNNMSLNNKNITSNSILCNLCNDFSSSKNSFVIYIGKSYQPSDLTVLASPGQSIFLTKRRMFYLLNQLGLCTDFQTCIMRGKLFFSHFGMLQMRRLCDNNLILQTISYINLISQIIICINIIILRVHLESTIMPGKQKTIKQKKQKSEVQSQSQKKDQNRDGKIDQPANSHNHVKYSLLQMTAPHCYHSQFYNSIFKGFYSVFFLYCSYFIFALPILTFLTKGQFFDLTVIKLMKTNLFWDAACTVLYFIIAILCLFVGNPVSRPSYIMISIYAIFLVGASYLIVDSFQMYFTDRIFIVVLGWGLFFKLATYQLDTKRFHKIKQQNAQKQHSKKSNPDLLQLKLLYLISPVASYRIFLTNYDSSLKINKTYLLKKSIVALACVFTNNALMVQFIDPLIQSSSNMSFIQLFFKLIPYAFFMNIVLYYMVIDNIFSAFAELTKLRDRRFYQDWWNAQTIAEFCEKWLCLMNAITKQYFQKYLKHKKELVLSIQVGILLILLLEIFGRGVNLQSILLFGFIVSLTYFLGYRNQIQNNYTVHICVICFTPLMIALNCKFHIFKEATFDS